MDNLIISIFFFKRFLSKFEYGNAVTADLWHELSGVSSQQLNITRIMDTWTRQMGYPVLTVRFLNEPIIKIPKAFRNNFCYLLNNLETSKRIC